MAEPETTMPKGTRTLITAPGEPGRLPTRVAFVVWVARDESGRFEGIVERVRTGEKQRFQGLESLPSLIAWSLGTDL